MVATLPVGVPRRHQQARRRGNDGGRPRSATRYHRGRWPMSTERRRAGDGPEDGRGRGVAVPRPERLAGRGDVRAVPERSGLGERELAASSSRTTGRAVPRPVTAALPRPLRPRLRRPRRPWPPRRRRRPPRSPPPRQPRPPRPRPPRSASPSSAPAPLIVANMERSLGVPTATSFRDVPAKLLEVNRKVINGYLGRSGAGKVSFTHLIAYAVVRTIADDMPAMNATFVEGADGKPRVVRHDHVNVGIAVDMEKADGTPHARSSPSSRRPTPSTSPASAPPTRTSSAGPRPASSRSPTSRAPPSPSPTPAPSAPSSRCLA